MLSFIKMNGTGNDFVIFDARKKKIKLLKSQIKNIAMRRIGVGCDQVIIMEPSKTADVFMRIYNADGSEVSSCGNATRCVAWIVMKENNIKKVSVETRAGILKCERFGKNSVRVDMGEPKIDWQEIPLSKQQNTLNLNISIGNLKFPTAVSMGNPHAVFVVSDVELVDIQNLGPKLEHNKLFPKGANISFAQQVGKSYVKLRVWERGSGATLACGTAACATLVALNRRGLINSKAKIEQQGGILEITWDKKTNHVWMVGSVEYNFSGSFIL